MNWIVNRGGTMFIFGTPGDLQHFKWGKQPLFTRYMNITELLLLGLTIGLIFPVLSFVTIHAMITIKQTTVDLKIRKYFILQNWRQNCRAPRKQWLCACFACFLFRWYFCKLNFNLISWGPGCGNLQHNSNGVDVVDNDHWFYIDSRLADRAVSVLISG